MGHPREGARPLPRRGVHGPGMGATYRVRMLISRVPVRLVLASALMLFLELALIRWTGCQLLHLSYFSNFVLLG